MYLENLYDIVASNKYRIWAGHSVHMDATPEQGVFFVVGKYSKQFPVPYTKREAEIVRTLAIGSVEYDTVKKLMDDCLRFMDGKALDNKAAYEAFISIVDNYSIRCLEQITPIIQKRHYVRRTTKNRKHKVPANAIVMANPFD